MSEADQNIASLLSEERVFEPPEAFVARAVVQDRSIYERADADHEAFWRSKRTGWLGQALGHRETWIPPGQVFEGGH